MMHEDWQVRRTLAIAQMAATTLAAAINWTAFVGDDDLRDETLNWHARNAAKLFDAVDKAATPPADPRPPFIGGPHPR